jgi:hypothetical protein
MDDSILLRALHNQLYSKMDDTHRPTPEWAMQSFHEFNEYLHRLMQVVRLTIRGISLWGPDAIKLAADIREHLGEPPETPSNLEAAEQTVKVAQEELAKDFPLVHAQAIVLVWGALENLTETFVARWIIKVPSLIQNEPWSDLRVRIGEYESLDQEERAYYLVTLLQNSIGAPMKRGINRFESVFGAVGLKGAVPDEVAQAVFELQQVRNNIVHNRGIVDRKLHIDCPWLLLTQGEELRVTGEMYWKYCSMAGKYVIEVIKRAKKGAVVST